MNNDKHESGNHLLVSKNWNIDLAKISYEDARANCLFAAIWGEKESGGYNSSDFHPFIALKKVVNEGIEAYEGISLGTSMDKIKRGRLPERRVNVHSRVYFPTSQIAPDADRITIVKDPNDIIDSFLKRWENTNQ